MTRRALRQIVVLLCAGLALAPAPARAVSIEMRMENLSGRAVVEAYAAPPDARVYTDHRIALDGLAASALTEITVFSERGCRFNLLVVFDDFTAIEQLNADLCAGTIMTVLDDRILVMR